MKNDFYVVLGVILMLAPILAGCVLSFVDGNFCYFVSPDGFASSYHPFIVYGAFGSFFAIVFNFLVFGKKWFPEEE